MSAVFIENAWYFGGWSKFLSAGDVRRTMLAGQDLALYRTESGTAAAIGNRCPHRFAPLHMGKVKGDALECGYHGVQFGSDGRCVFNPHLRGATPGSVSVPGYPVVERDGAIWIWLSLAADPDPSIIPDMSGLSSHAPDALNFVPTMQVDADYKLIAENLVDPTHADYLHAGVLGGSGAYSAVQPVVEASTHFVRFDWSYDGVLAIPYLAEYLPGVTEFDTWIVSEWYAPGMSMVLGGVKPKGAPREEGVFGAAYHLYMPTADRKSTYDVVGFRNFALDSAEVTERMQALSSYVFNNEDKPMIEAQQKMMGGSSFWDLKPTLFPTDAPSIKIRRAYEALASV